MQANVVKCLFFIAMTHLSGKRSGMLRWFKAAVAACLCLLGRISEKTRLGAGSVFTAAVPDGGGGLGSSASSQRFNVFTCNLSLNVQCLSCSVVLRPSQWIGSSFGAEGRRPAWEMGPTCAAWWNGSAAPGPRALAAGRGPGLCWPPSAPASRSLGGGRGITPRTPPAGTAGSRSSAASARPSARAPVGTSAALSGGGGWAPLGQICCAVQVPSRRPPFAQTHTDGHNAQTRHGICPPDLARSSGKRDHKCNRL
ncbi:uncharacterized protein LOC114014827 isoform X1 [Falco cherrug]|uniref:uncharacterized protein LOC114014827 isoform X1 n=1 Tax=Falco cherrug TaxID=345164 RepID=UPI00247998EE|nr:uncharacterized protein LOC114014827 isoform X1 [Falco cherrug]XP_055557982.1 uncharacterized protein LOC114014827 isoform X1 [Falco cherrug]XP_055557992.1 uncharacterized protein LOC114014827 isoform X1 [Falco cherrug]